MKCKRCGKKTNHKKFCSQKCYWESLKGIRGENAPNYKKIVGKNQVHKWLTVHYGRIEKCEGNNCKENTFIYEWALKKGCLYERKRENFLRLCRSCHRIYDLTDEKIKKAVNNLWWKTGIKNPGVVHVKNLWWQKDKERTMEYMKSRGKNGK